MKAIVAFVLLVVSASAFADNRLPVTEASCNRAKAYVEFAHDYMHHPKFDVGFKINSDSRSKDATQAAGARLAREFFKAHPGSYDERYRNWNVSNVRTWCMQYVGYGVE